VRLGHTVLRAAGLCEGHRRSRKAPHGTLSICRLPTAVHSVPSGLPKMQPLRTLSELSGTPKMGTRRRRVGSQQGSCCVQHIRVCHRPAPPTPAAKGGLFSRGLDLLPGAASTTGGSAHAARGLLCTCCKGDCSVCKELAAVSGTKDTAMAKRGMQWL